MVKYSVKPENPTKVAKARGSNLRVHYKNCREVGAFLKDMKLTKAIKYVEDVIEHKRAIPFTVHTGGCGRHAQGKLIHATGDQVGWPEKACKFFLDLLKNAAANAETKGLDSDTLVLTHVQVNRAVQMRRRTYRAHGRIGPYMCSPCHIELIVTESGAPVKKAAEDGSKRTLSRKRLAMQRLRSGGGVTAA